MPVDVMQLSYVLSSVASGGKIIESAINLLKMGMDANYDLLKIEADKAAQGEVAGDDQEDIKELASKIPPVILNAANENIEELHNNIANILRSKAMSRVEKEQRLEEERRSICWFIVQVSEHGEVPDSLMSVWDGSKCAERGFVLK